MKKNVKVDDFLLSFQEIWKFNKLLIVLLIFEVIVNALAPFPGIVLSGRIIDSLAGSGDFSTVVYYVLLLFSFGSIVAILNIFIKRKKEYLILMFGNKLNNDINRKCMNVDFEQFNDPSFQDRILLINQVSQGNNFFTNITTVFEIISSFITLIGVVWIMSTLNIWLFSIAVAVIFLQALLYIIRLRYYRDYKSDIVHEQRKSGYLSRLAKDIAIKKEFIMFDMSDFIMKKIESFQKAMLELDTKRISVEKTLDIANHFLSVAFQISAYILVGINTFNGKNTIGDFSVGLSSLITFMSATTFITHSILNYNDGVYYIRRYKSFQKLRTKYEGNNKLSASDLDLNDFEIEFRNVSFRYPNSTSYVLKDINLTIKKGEKLALVGYNGAGKTTFTLLLTRMYDPTEGAIYLNGIDIKEINYREYQKIFSSVNQDFSLLAFSLLENIAIADDVSPETRRDITMLFENNGLKERIAKMYRGLDTPVTKSLDASGVDLSGGERQKVAIIRALYKASPVLILDEPTAALDPMSEYETYQNFVDMARNKTAILVSHRIYSTRFCEKIAVFEKGEMVEYGTFDELMENKGLYYEFYNKQSEYFKS